MEREGEGGAERVSFGTMTRRDADEGVSGRSIM